jgi:exopolysaccharide biosynthesis polyprenyl glycosylphosphotransferase
MMNRSGQDTVEPAARVSSTREAVYGSDPAPETDTRRSAIRAYRFVALGEVATDATCLLVTLAVLLGAGIKYAPNGIRLPAIVLAPIVWVGIFHAFGLYRVVQLPASDEFRRILGATTVGVGVLLLAEEWWGLPLSRGGLVLTWLVALFLELVARRLWRWMIRRGKRRGRLALRTLVVGTNDEATQIADAISAPVRGFVPVAFVATTTSRASELHLPVVNLADLERAVADLSVECLFVASSAAAPDQVATVAKLCRRAGLEFRVSANVPDVFASRLSVQPVQDVIVLSVRPARLTRTQAVLKRGFDLVVASSLLVLTLPMTVMIAIAIRLSSPGPVLFRQPRVTKGERVFTIYKFRTMVVDPEPALQGKLIDLTRPFFKIQDDPRLTPVGRFLRTWSFDELPQLWNVFRGDMSLVGPRPLFVDQVRSDPQGMTGRHEVPAGITGWWQINGRSDVDYERALQLDLFYIENWSIGLDLYILLKTVGAIVTRRGAV